MLASPDVIDGVPPIWPSAQQPELLRGGRGHRLDARGQRRHRHPGRRRQPPDRRTCAATASACWPARRPASKSLPTPSRTTRSGVQAGGTARVDTRDNIVGIAGRVGISFAESSTGTVHGNRIGAGAPVGIEVAGTASPAVEGNIVEGAGAVGVSFVESASGTASLNTVTGRDVGIQVGGSAAPALNGNHVGDSRLVGMLFADQATGSATGNTVIGSVGSAIQVAGTARPEITANELRGGEYGLAYFDGAAGTASTNRVLEHRVGIQLAGTAAPRLAANELDGIEQAAIVYAESSAGEATGNHCRSASAAGIALAPTASPTLDGNDCAIARAG